MVVVLLNINNEESSVPLFQQATATISCLILAGDLLTTDIKHFCPQSFCWSSEKSQNIYPYCQFDVAHKHDSFRAAIINFWSLWKPSRCLTNSWNCKSSSLTRLTFLFPFYVITLCTFFPHVIYKYVAYEALPTRSSNSSCACPSSCVRIDPFCKHETVLFVVLPSYLCFWSGNFETSQRKGYLFFPKSWTFFQSLITVSVTGGPKCPSDTTSRWSSA
jgi:hypothetical protein